MRIGEIVETTSTTFVAQSFALNRPPPLGQLVMVKECPSPSASSTLDLYAIVAHGRTAGIDPSRRAIRRSTEDVFDAAVYQASPELVHVLRTEFTGALVGYRMADQCFQHLPPQPPPLHYSVHDAELNDLTLFTNTLDYLRFLRELAGEVPALQVLAAHIREVYAYRHQDSSWLLAAARETAQLLKDDYDAQLTVLRAIEPQVLS